MFVPSSSGLNASSGLNNMTRAFASSAITSASLGSTNSSEKITLMS